MEGGVELCVVSVWLDERTISTESCFWARGLVVWLGPPGQRWELEWWPLWHTVWVDLQLFPEANQRKRQRNARGGKTSSVQKVFIRVLLDRKNENGMYAFGRLGRNQKSHSSFLLLASYSMRQTLVLHAPLVVCFPSARLLGASWRFPIPQTVKASGSFWDVFFVLRNHCGFIGPICTACIHVLGTFLEKHHKPKCVVQ